MFIRVQLYRSCTVKYLLSLQNFTNRYWLHHQRTRPTEFRWRCNNHKFISKGLESNILRILTRPAWLACC